VSAPEPFVDPAMGQVSDTRTLRTTGPPSHSTEYVSAVAVVPLALDGLALLLGVVVVGRDTAVGWAYAAAAIALLIGGSNCWGRINPRVGDDLPRLLGLLALPVLLLAPFFPPSEIGELAKAVPLVATFVLIARAASYWLIRTVRSRGLIAEPTLVVGTGELGHAIANTLFEHPEYGLKPVGILGHSVAHRGRDPELRSIDRLPLPLMGSVDRLDRVVREQRIRRVIVAFDRTSEEGMLHVLRKCDRLPVEVHVMPRLFELGVAPASPTTDDVWGISLMRLKRSAHRSLQWRMKRVVDIVVAGVLLILTAPVMIVSIIAIRATSAGPAFFRQVRVGQRGQRFRVIKLRTMYVNEDGDTAWTIDGNHRVTRVGRFLRETSIDELPQLINVLMGQMSLVGPRPERPFFSDRFQRRISGYEDRQRVPAGITGWAQVHGLRGDTSVTERSRFDNQYIEHWSIWQDTVILARTFGAVLREMVP
jgi:exopolysaccharide biosynthesis polyprenyl glycosylphosphotransferase